MSVAAVLSSLDIHAQSVNDLTEQAHVTDTISFIRARNNAFERVHDTGGHVGASAVVIDPIKHRLLLTRHTVLGHYSFFGNHCDGNADLPHVALLRIFKDAGAHIAGKCVLKSGIFDVDIHHVPAHSKGTEQVPAHLHYDIAYLFHLHDTDFIMPDTCCWLDYKQAFTHLANDPQAQRIIRKLVALAGE